MNEVSAVGGARQRPLAPAPSAPDQSAPAQSAPDQSAPDQSAPEPPPRTVGLVVVSHSQALAAAAVAMAQQLLPAEQVRIRAAAGLPDGVLGTDATRIRDAIVAADQGAGVVVLMDLGSAVLSADLALELLEDDIRDRVVLCPAALVEGLVAALAAAAGGAGRTQVAAEAVDALSPKITQLAADPGDSGSAGAAEDCGVPRDSGGDTAGDSVVGSFTVRDTHGLHARPAARLVREAREFDARVRLRNRSTGSAWVAATSLVKVATLAAAPGHEVEVEATGRQARAVLRRLLTLAGRGFGEASTGAPVVSTPGAPLAGAPGIGIGPARQAWALGHHPRPAEPGHRAAMGEPRDADPAAEWSRLRDALDTVRDELSRLRARGVTAGDAASIGIFDVHLTLLDDPDLCEELRRRVDRAEPTASAWASAINRMAEELSAVPDPYLAERATDIRAVGEQVLRVLSGAPHTGAPPTGARPGVLVVDDLTPAEAAELDPTTIHAVVMARGSPTAHSTILLRARGIPAVVGAGPDVLRISAGTVLIVDGSRAEVIVDPSPDVLRDWRTRIAEHDRALQQARAHAAAPARTRDGVTVAVGASIAAVEDATLAVACGADLAGLVRTEFLFLGRAHAPHVAEQEEHYRGIAVALDGRRVVFRTLDAGADKPLPYLPHPRSTQANPALGMRGIRFALAHPSLLADQLLAMVRVAHDWPVSVMFPMISGIDELRRARGLLDDAIRSAGQGQPEGLEFGIMVEVPATALKATALAPHVDFLSIGTNDLTQYALAADRGDDAVAHLADPLDPGVLRLVAAVCQAAPPGLAVSVCGEVAADERACPLLVGLGVRQLSVVPAAIPLVKRRVRALGSHSAAELARRALDLDSPTAVRHLLADADALAAPSPAPPPAVPPAPPPGDGI